MFPCLVLLLGNGSESEPRGEASPIQQVVGVGRQAGSHTRLGRVTGEGLRTKD